MALDEASTSFGKENCIRASEEFRIAVWNSLGAVHTIDIDAPLSTLKADLGPRDVLVSANPYQLRQSGCKALQGIWGLIYAITSVQLAVSHSACGSKV